MRNTVADDEALLQRIGADLHDGPAQLIALALLYLDATGRSANDRPDTIGRVQGLLEQALTDIRSIAYDLSAPGIEDFSLNGAVETAIARHEVQTGTMIVCHMTGTPRPAPAALVAGVYRFVQESLCNSFKHAQGATVHVSVDHASDDLTVSVDDDGGNGGGGLSSAKHVSDPGAAAPINGGSRNSGYSALGLVGLRRRIAALDGNLEIYTGSGPGTRAVARFRLPACS
jgi:signal transduction histidine kinase